MLTQQLDDLVSQYHLSVKAIYYLRNFFFATMGNRIGLSVIFPFVGKGNQKNFRQIDTKQNIPYSVFQYAEPRTYSNVNWRTSRTRGNYDP